MSRADVQDILQRIDALPRVDRDRLEQELAARSERAWLRLAQQATRSCPRTKNHAGHHRPSRRATPLRPAMKIFFDTNVYIAEALLGRAAGRMVAATRAAHWRVYGDPHPLEE